MTAPDAAPDAAPASDAPGRSGAIRGVRGALLALAVGVAAAALGLLPWILAGLRLPLQDLWAQDVVSAADMPLALLPLNQYTVALLAAVIVVGGGLAGAAARILRPRLPRAGAWLVVAGLVVAQALALLQAATVTADGLGVDDPQPVGVDRTGAVISEAQVYLVAFVGGTVAAIAVAAVVALVLALAPVGLAVVAAAVPAALLAAWVTGAPPVVDGGWIGSIDPALTAVAAGSRRSRSGSRSRRRGCAARAGSWARCSRRSCSGSARRSSRRSRPRSDPGPSSAIRWSWSTSRARCSSRPSARPRACCRRLAVLVVVAVVGALVARRRVRSAAA
ncbi:hypothetical protein [Clavibacter tessellarius]|uniref:hypothetical protein n=1 Tax=Clavibacter tessellarius TaxID=31965 RepID=UPI0032496630